MSMFPLKLSRTLPRVRELKHVLRCVLRSLIYGRTLPRVRELKLVSNM